MFQWKYGARCCVKWNTRFFRPVQSENQKYSKKRKGNKNVNQNISVIPLPLPRSHSSLTRLHLFTYYFSAAYLSSIYLLTPSFDYIFDLQFIDLFYFLCIYTCIFFIKRYGLCCLLIFKNCRGESLIITRLRKRIRKVRMCSRPYLRRLEQWRRGQRQVVADSRSEGIHHQRWWLSGNHYGRRLHHVPTNRWHPTQKWVSE